MGKHDLGLMPGLPCFAVAVAMVHCNPAPGLPMRGKVPWLGLVSLPPSLGTSSTRSCTGIDGSIQRAAPAPRELGEQSGGTWCSMESVRPRLLLLDRTRLPVLLRASEGPWIGKNTLAGTMQLGRSRSWYQTALKTCLKYTAPLSLPRSLPGSDLC